MFLQHDNARPCASAATFAATESIGYEDVQHPTAAIWHRPNSGCSEFSRYISRELVSRVIKNFKFLRGIGFEKSLNRPVSTGSRNMFSSGGVMSNEKELRGKIVIETE
jgi:hypothetical protein